MPEWIHKREEHIRAKNPGMPESEAWAIATQQAHATGKSPKGYGTAKGRHEAKAKYDTPSDDKKTADPGGVGARKFEKDAFILRALAPVVAQENDDRMRQIIREELQANHPHHKDHHKQPSIKVKEANISAPFPLALIGGFSDEMRRIKIAQMTMNSVAPKPTVSSQVTSRVPRNTMSAKMPTYSQMNPSAAPGPAQSHQPTLEPPPVRG